MGIAGKIFGKISYELAKRIKPEMISIKRFNGVSLTGTRVSNHTHISFPENLQLGSHVFIGHFNYIDCYKKTIIEDGCQISNFISVMNHSSHLSMRLYGESFTYAKNPKGTITGEVRIGKFSYIGPHSVIMPGTDMGKGCIVAAYSYISGGKFPDFAIIKGNPAKVIGDSRNLDLHLLEENSELKSWYDQWTKK